MFYAGLKLPGFTLSRRLSPKKYKVTVISPRSYFAFTPLLNSTASGTLEFRAAIEPVRHKRLPHIEFLQGWADGLDLWRKTVMVEENVAGTGREMTAVGDGRVDGSGKIQEQRREKQIEKKGEILEVQYDKLVIAVGCYSNTFGTKGVKENAFFLKDVGGARAIRKRILECFEVASLPNTLPEFRKQLLHFAVVGGGPTGMEFAAELSDFISQDLIHFYPDVEDFVKITVYDVAERVLSMFDKQLVDFAMKTYSREGIEIRTSHHVEELRRGLPKAVVDQHPEIGDFQGCFTLKTKEDGETGVGMCLWSTGNMMNPFIQRVDNVSSLPNDAILKSKNRDIEDGWHIKKSPKSGALLVDSHLRLQLTAGPNQESQAILPSVFAFGDNAQLEHASLPVTAQTANQQAIWLGKRLNMNDFDKVSGFTFKNMGIMTYLGSAEGLLQRDAGPGKSIRGRTAWLIWRGAYLTMSVSWRNKILIPIYW
ncbi:MAG: hypothetical protein LQ340_005697 [Diploschistes diacapsis]|nr:MAG: hypothetical protein LQ340_005697 [Diploschistes diacapsis]